MGSRRLRASLSKGCSERPPAHQARENRLPALEFELEIFIGMITTTDQTEFKFALRSSIP